LKYYSSISLEALRRTSVRTECLRIVIVNGDHNPKQEYYAIGHDIWYNMDVKKIRLEVVDWINLSQDMDQSWALSMRAINVH
jgi:hypothetical protein